jgi:hypothetical protein
MPYSPTLRSLNCPVQDVGFVKTHAIVCDQQADAIPRQESQAYLNHAGRPHGAPTLVRGLLNQPHDDRRSLAQRFGLGTATGDLPGQVSRLGNALGS